MSTPSVSGNGCHILISSARKVHYDYLVSSPWTGPAFWHKPQHARFLWHGIMPSVLERYSKASTASVICNRHVLCPSGFRQMCMLRSDSRIIQSCGNGIHRCDLSIFILTEIRISCHGKPRLSPRLMVAACLSVSTPSPAASQPIKPHLLIGDEIHKKPPWHCFLLLHRQ